MTITLDRPVTLEDTALKRLDQEARLLNAVFKGPTPTPGRFGFRGDIALKFQAQVADEKRPPDFSIEQVLLVIDAGEPTIPVLAGYIHSLEYLGVAAEVLRGLLRPDGTYYLFCNNIDLLARYLITIDGITYQVLPLDESTVWKEMTDLLMIDKNDIKKLDTGGKLNFVMQAALESKPAGEVIGYEDALKKMGPVRNRNENRPV